MKIIFLDIDGVLNTTQNIIRQKENGINNIDEIDSSALNNLKDIVLTSDTYIVITSSWRISENNFQIWQLEKERKSTNKHWDCLIKKFKEIGILDHIIGVTPELFDKDGKELSKPFEIISWIESHWKYNIEKIVVLDDEDKKLNSLFFGNRFIECNKETGLTKEKKDKAIKFLSANNKQKNK